MSVKKVFEPLVTLLKANETKTVKSIMDQVLELASAKGAGGVATASHKVDGKLVAVRCSFFEKWFPVSHVEFGNKEGSATGLNPMCKEGANMFSQLQRQYKAGKEAILAKVQKGELKPDQIANELAILEKARVDRPAYSVAGMGWDTIEELQKVTPAALDKLVTDHKAKVAKEEAAVKAKAEADAKAKAEADAKAKADKKAAPAGEKVAPAAASTKV